MVSVAASFAFYAWWSLEYGLLIVATIAVNFAFGRTLQELAERRPGSAKVLLVVAVSANLALLGYFKYCDFFVENVNGLTGSDWALAHVVLPLAISFHTFQQIAYLVIHGAARSSSRRSAPMRCSCCSSRS